MTLLIKIGNLKGQGFVDVLPTAGPLFFSSKSLFMNVKVVIQGVQLFLLDVFKCTTW